MHRTALFLFTLMILTCPPPPVVWAGGKAPPLKLEAGKAILEDGAKLYLPRGTQVESGGKQLTTLNVTRLWVVPTKHEKWAYEIRPVGVGYLQIKVAQDAFKGVTLLRPSIAFDDGRVPDGGLGDHHLVTAGAGVTWMEQPYEIYDRAGKLLFTTQPPPGTEPAVPAPPQKERHLFIHLQSTPLPARLTLPESPRGVTSITLTASVNLKGEGQGTLILDPNTLRFNEVGDVIGTAGFDIVGISCSLKFVKMGKVRLDGPPGLDHVGEWPIYEIRGEKITSRLFLISPTKDLQSGRLLIQDKAGKVTSVIALESLPPPQPCHPGCFPAGTLIHTPTGTRPIDSLGVGDAVITIRPDGTSVSGKVQTIFVTRNQLVRVETDDGVLVTTPTQPLVREDGVIRTTEELKPGDKIFRWVDGKRQAVTIRAIVRTDRQDKVFNLVLGNSEVFVAGGFLARSKPPIVAAETHPHVHATVPTSKR